MLTESEICSCPLPFNGFITIFKNDVSTQNDQKEQNMLAKDDAQRISFIIS